MLLDALLCQFRFASPLAIVIFCSTNSFENFSANLSPFFEHFLAPIMDIIFVFNSSLFPSIYSFLGGFLICFNFSG